MAGSTRVRAPTFGRHVGVTPETRRSARRPAIHAIDSTQVHEERRPIDPAGIQRHGGPLYAPWLHSDVSTDARSGRHRRFLARRVLLPLSWVEIRPRRARLQERSGSDQPRYPTLPLRLRRQLVDRRRSEGMSPRNTNMNMRTLVIDIAGMTCNGCISSVQRAIGKLDGVSAAAVAFPSDIAAVQIDPDGVTPVQIEQGIEKLAIGAYRRGPADFFRHAAKCRSDATSYPSHRPEWGRQSAAHEGSPRQAGGPAARVHRSSTQGADHDLACGELVWGAVRCGVHRHAPFRPQRAWRSWRARVTWGHIGDDEPAKKAPDEPGAAKRPGPTGAHDHHHGSARSRSDLGQPPTAVSEAGRVEFFMVWSPWNTWN
jgi:copper chaperone CopZ